MAKKILVFHHNHFLDDLFPVEQKTLSSAPTSRAALLERRHAKLHHLADTVIRSAGQDPDSFSKIAHAQAPLPDRLHKKYKVLQGIGAVLMEEDLLDIDMLQSVPGISVLENARIAAIVPKVQAEGTTPDFWHLEKINASALHTQGMTGKDVVVGVLDSGIDPSHQEFSGKKIWYAKFDEQGNQVNEPPGDAGRHGTHVSALIAGKQAGVAPDASLAVAAVLTEYMGLAGHLAQILAGLDWLIKTDFITDPDRPGVHLINASFEAGTNNFLYNTVETAGKVPGTLLVGAIGDHGSHGVNSSASPGNYDIVLGIGATDRQDNVASLSAWGTASVWGTDSENTAIAKPDMCAPGVGIWSAVPGPGNQYLQMDGTSMASPLVCGAAALLVQQYPDLAYKPALLREAILKLVHPLNEDSTRAGRGRLQLPDLL